MKRPEQEPLVELAQPCDMPWGEMTPVDAVQRHCARCDRHVFDLSAMTEARAREFMAERGQTSCVGFVTDALGAIIHEPERRRARPAPRQLEGALSLLAAAALIAPLGLLGCDDNSTTRQAESVTPIVLEHDEAALDSASVGASAAPSFIAPREEAEQQEVECDEGVDDAPDSTAASVDEAPPERTRRRHAGVPRRRSPTPSSPLEP